jgi:8-oxo-dGTP pyrophosphatase MutT (NUDIX family)
MNPERRDYQMSAVRQPYVLGFLFSSDFREVLLVEKQKGPQINIGKWNGVGGKIEKTDVSSLDAMHREFHEEVSHAADWQRTGSMWGTYFDIVIFKATSPVRFNAPATNDVQEKLKWWSVEEILATGMSIDVAQNVRTLITHMVSGAGLLEIKV